MITRDKELFPILDRIFRTGPDWWLLPVSYDDYANKIKEAAKEINEINKKYDVK